jgi:hypothetical protein
MRGEMPAHGAGKLGQPVLAFGKAGKVARPKLPRLLRLMPHRAAHRFKDRAAVEGKLFLGRVKDLDQHALHPTVGGAGKARLDPRQVAQEVRQEHARPWLTMPSVSGAP